ncbi:Myotubularin-related protein 12 [Varanus komodoensis]|nr:Myotubularin-related protein 12 [Varanus komodoensis]
MGGINYVRRSRALLVVQEQRQLPQQEADDDDEAESSWEELPPPPAPASSSSSSSSTAGTWREGEMLGAAASAGAKPAKPSFVSYISPEPYEDIGQTNCPMVTQSLIDEHKLEKQNHDYRRITQLNVISEEIKLVKDFTYLASVINSKADFSQEIRKLNLERAAVNELEIGSFETNECFQDDSLETKAKIIQGRESSEKEVYVREPTEKEVDPHLLPGELLLCEANMVLKYIKDDGSNRGTYGKLICTNFKISFLGEESALEDEPQFKNAIVGENDITLQCVDQLYGVYDEKKKSLYGQLRKYPETIIIYCKDLRVFHFCLRYTKEEEVKRIVSGIVHQTQTPKLFKRLFLFSYATAVPNATEIKTQTMMFDSIKDWRQELERTKGNLKFKAMSANEGYKISKRLPAYFVVPMAVSEECILQYQGRGIPEVDAWNLFCLESFSPGICPKREGSVECLSMIIYVVLNYRMYKTIDKPPYEAMKIDDLSNSLPSLQEIQVAYIKFKQLFLIDNSGDFWDTDVKWFSLLESTNWLEIIRRCLRKAVEVIESLEAQNTNVLLIGKLRVTWLFFCVPSTQLFLSR